MRQEASNKKTTYRVGIVGARDIVGLAPGPAPLPFQNEIILSHVASLALIPRAELVAVCRLDPTLHGQFESDWGGRWPNASLYTDYNEMLAQEDLDLVGVATPDNYHAGITVAAANAGVKGIFCEKPLATSMEDADRMIRACEDNGAVLSVDHTRRWSALHHKVRDTVRSGAIGPLSTIVATLGGERAMLFRNGTHIIDSICFYAESEPVQVFAHLEKGYDDWNEYKGDGGVESDSEPGASGYMLFRNGVRALYCGTKGSINTYSLELTGPEGQVFIDDSTAHLRTRDQSTGEDVRRPLLPPQYQVEGLVAAWQELIGLVESGGVGVSPAREARKTLQIIFGFLGSHQQGSRLIEVVP